ncbi:TonB-dependent receptor [Flavivirga amylovorans]|uniref:TonB-dependent receptor n=1 Tax=Flavivirga amylovorans TaxID=870486 RepID=A0ABT8X2J5_9FLAO|nr:TonB-dependent receptor [Flavivirga amylovorans]MDO5988173.1 TonB-dependent receptor [Flavivirga amylovorans]
MKLTVYLFFISLFQIQASGHSQNVKVTLNLNNVSYHEVFRAIESQTEFNVLYNHAELNHEKQISINVKKTLLIDVLKQLFENTNIDYKTVGKQIILVNRISTETKATQIQIKGEVKDEFGNPLIGVNVVEQGTTNGSVTDFDGNYTISVSNKNAVLKFSYIGFVNKVVTVGEQRTINVVLKENVSELESVVVVGYGTVKKSDLTGSVSSVDIDEIDKTQVPSLAQAIQGRAAGIAVSKTSGQPGSTPTVRIRGIGTVNNADPLYIVDGVPINNIANINFSDAESVEVLKDASATAIYGSRAANGVILVTTKKGKKNKAPLISYSHYYGFERKIDNLDVLNAEQWATLNNEGRTNDGNAINPDLADPASLESFNWKDAVYRTGEVTNHQLSVTGGTDKTSYYFSFGQFDQKGIVKNASFKRTNLRINNTYQIKPKIKLGHNIQYTKAKTVGVLDGGINSNLKTAFTGYAIDPASPIFNEDGTPARPLFSNEIPNPVGSTIYNLSPSSREGFLGNVFINIDLLKGLTFSSNYGLEINNGKVDNFQEEFFISAEQNRPANIYRLNRSENRTLIWFNTLNYQTTFNEKHDLTALLGHETQKSRFNSVNATRSNIPEGVENPTLDSGAIDTASNSGRITQSNLLSFFGRLNYNYDQRYLLTATYRADGSSRFGSNNNFAYFPSLAFAWNLNNEKFFDLETVNQVKFRVGWGETGNQNIPNSAIFSTISTNNNYVFGDTESAAIGLGPTRPGNPDLKWETTTTTNLGVDLAFLKNSITFSADYFIKNTSDLLLETPIQRLSGFSGNPTVNAGEIENRGFEFVANFKRQIGDFNFSIGGNISFIENEVKSLADEGSVITSGRAGNGFVDLSRTEVGLSLASFYGLEMIGIFQNQDEIDNNASLPGNQPGDVRYRDIDGNGEINDDDRKIIGSPLPDFTYGINLDLAYKQFDLSAFFQGSKGNDIFNATGWMLEGFLDSNLSTEFLNRWTGEGTSNTVPRATFDGFPNNNLASSRFVEDGSYLRLKNIQLGYTIPKSVLNKTFISFARLYVAGQNLITFTKYKGLDPELGIDNTQTQDGNRTTLDIGIDRGRYPSSRTISFGIDVNF